MPENENWEKKLSAGVSDMWGEISNMWARESTI